LRRLRAALRVARVARPWRGRASLVRRGSAEAGPWAPGAVGGARGLRLHAAPRLHRAPDAPPRGDPVSLGAAARALPGLVRADLRGSGLVPALVVPAAARRGPRRRVRHPHALQSEHLDADPALLGDAVRRVHGVPRRAGALEAAPALPDRLLPDARAGRRARR